MSFYVYFNITDDDRIFYVGKGKGKRHQAKGSARNEVWNRIATKHGFKSKIMLSTDDEQVAFNEEIRLIAEHNTYVGKDAPKDAWGANLTRGGEGAAGYCHTQEVKQALSEAAKGNSHAKGRKKSPTCSTCHQIGHDKLHCPPDHPECWLLLPSLRVRTLTQE